MCKYYINSRWICNVYLSLIYYVNWPEENLKKKMKEVGLLSRLCFGMLPTSMHSDATSYSYGFPSLQNSYWQLLLWFRKASPATAADTSWTCWTVEVEKQIIQTEERRWDISHSLLLQSSTVKMSSKLVLSSPERWNTEHALHNTQHSATYKDYMYTHWTWFICKTFQFVECSCNQDKKNIPPKKRPSGVGLIRV